MISDAKLAANRRNAQKSTGPRTLSGKAIASMNAVKHGLCSRKPLVIGESEAEFGQFSSDWLRRLRPLGVHERFLAEQVIMAVWQLRRVPRLRAGLLILEIRNDSSRSEAIHPFAMRPDAYVNMSRIDRNETVLQRNFDRAFKELERVQAERGDADPLDEQEVEGLVQNEPTGRTQVEHTVIVMRNQPLWQEGTLEPPMNTD